jgi:hypothetical protein
VSSDPELQQLEEKLSALDAERAKLILEINNLRNASASNTSQRKLPPFLGRPALSQPPVAPIAAYDQKNSRVLVLDPDREWYEPYWVSEDSLLTGMATEDTTAHAFRGYIKIQLPSSN